MFDYAPPHMDSEFRWTQVGKTSPQLRITEPVRRTPGRGTYAGLEFIEVESRRIINTMANPGKLPFRHTINVYRGCSHACVYCFARPTHEYLGLGRGRDFESKIVVKVDAVDLVRRETAPGRWGGELIAMGTNTDPYQPAEGKYRLTRGIVEVLGERANPFSILTKSPLVLRDTDALAAAAERCHVTVSFSVGTLDEAVWRATEPATAHPQRRIDAVAKLNAAGVPSGVLIGPVLPELSDSPEQIERVVAAAIGAGAVSVGAVLLHLKKGVKEHYLEFLADAHPELVEHHRRHYRNRTYAATTQQHQLSETVRRLVAAHGGVRHHPQRQTKPRPEPPSAEPATDQLTLRL